MKVYRYQLTRTIKLLIVLGLVLSVAAFGLNTYQLIRYGLTQARNEMYGVLQYVLMYFVCVALFVILLSLLVCSRYVIDDHKLIVQFGFIKSKYDLDKVTRILLSRKRKKLAMYVADGSFFLVAVKEEWFEDFVNDILKINPSITYEIESIDKPEEEQK